MNLDLSGKTVLITGASRGIGLAIARAFAREGARLTLTARNEDGLRAAAADLPAGTKPVLCAGDMTVEKDIRRAFDAAAGANGRVDVVVANIGSGASLPGPEIPRAEWERLMAINFLGAADLAGLAASRLTRPEGSLVFISSIAGLEDIGAPPAYAAAKAALQALVKSYARLLGPEGIRVNAVAPGNVLFPGGTWERKMSANRDAVESMIRTTVPLSRFGTPEEIAEPVLFLASPRASFVTGATWVIDGGQTRGSSR